MREESCGAVADAFATGSVALGLLPRVALQQFEHALNVMAADARRKRRVVFIMVGFYFFLARPPFLAGALLTFLPRPEPDFLPPLVDLFTVAQARFLAVFFETPFFS